MKPKNCSGYDGISMKIIKSVKNILADPLAMTIKSNASYRYFSSSPKNSQSHSHI